MSTRAIKSVVDSVGLLDEQSVKAITRAMGKELRLAREARGWSRGYLAARLPSGIGPRTLLSYEHGTRHLTMLRFIEVCRALGVSAPGLLALALQRAQIDIDSLVLRVDLWALVADDTAEFRTMVLWAHNKLIENPSGIVEIAPAGVKELATVAGCPRSELASYFTRFTPKLEDITEEDDRSLILS